MALCVKENSAQTKIRQDILNLLNTRFGVLPDKVQANGGHLWGTRDLLNPCGMVYLVHILEDRYEVRFSETNFDDPPFYTIDGLVHIIAQKRNL